MRRLGLLFLVLGLLCSCGGGAGTAPVGSAIFVMLTPSGTTTLDQGQIVNFTANVANDPSNKGVTWSVSGSGCSGSACGSFSATTTSSATYNAPSPVPAALTVSVTATSAANTTRSASSTVIINPAPALATTSLPSGSLGAAYLAPLAASGGTGTLAWSLASGSLPAGLTLSGGGAIPGTGLSYTAAISGTPTAAGQFTFTLQVTDSASPPVSTISPPLTITIYKIWAEGCGSSGNEAAFSGQYAFTLSGFSGAGYLAVTGAFTADGAGKITAGEVDTNGVLGAQTASINPSASAYSVGSDNRACATIATSFGVFNARFAIGTFSSSVATEGRVIEWETGSGAFIGSGQILQQTASSFGSGPSGNYAFGLTGWDPSVQGPMAIAGVLAASGGAFTNVDQDVNDAGTPSANMTGLTGTYTSLDSNGRGTASFYDGGNLTSTATLYMVSASKLLFLQSSTPFLVGELDQQTVPSGGFSNSSINGPAVFFTNATDNGGAGADAHFGLFSGNGTGSATVADYDDDEGISSPVDNYSCTYSVGANGRVTITGGTGRCAEHPPVLYLTTANTGYIVGTGANVDFGALESQVGSNFTAASLSGAYYFGPVEVVNQAVVTVAGILTLNGSGGISYTLDLTSTNGEGADETSTATITVNSDGTFSVSGAGGAVSGVVISSSKFVLNESPTAPYPTLSLAQQ